MIEKAYLALKVLLFVYILMSPFVPVSKSLDNVWFKVFVLVGIVLATFADIQLGVVLTIAFLVFMINVNKGSMKKKTESFSVDEPIYNSPEMKEVVQPPFFETMVKLPNAQCNDMTYYRDQISNDLFEVYIDEKVKPYEEFIRKMTSPEQLEMAQNNEIAF